MLPLFYSIAGGSTQSHILTCKYNQENIFLKRQKWFFEAWKWGRSHWLPMPPLLLLLLLFLMRHRRTFPFLCNELFKLFNWFHHSKYVNNFLYIYHDLEWMNLLFIPLSLSLSPDLWVTMNLLIKMIFDSSVAATTAALSSSLPLSIALSQFGIFIFHNNIAVVGGILLTEKWHTRKRIVTP